MKHILALALCLPVCAVGAEQRALTSFHCESRNSAQRPGLQAHAMAPLTELAVKHGLIKADLANVDAIQTLALVQFSRERFTESAATTKIVSGIWERQKPSVELAARIRQQAQRYHRQTDCDGAQALYTIALGMASGSAGDRHLVTIGIMSDLTKLYRVNRQASLAAPLYQRIAAALAAAPALGAQEPALYLDLSELAYRYRAFDMAEHYARTALRHIDTGAAAHAGALIGALNEHAAALYALGRLDEGDKQRERARQLVAATGRKRQVAALSPLEQEGGVLALYRRGDLAGAIGKMDEQLRAAQAKQASLAGALTRLESAPARTAADGEPARQRALDAARGEMFAQQNALIFLLISSGELYYSQQGLDQAEAQYRRALALLKDRKSDNSPLVGHASYGLGVLLRSRGMLAQAEQLQQSAYAIAEQDLGADHPNAVEARLELADLAAAQGKLAEAGAHYTALVAIARQHAGGTRDDAMLVASLNSLAALYARQGRNAAARAIKAELATLNSAK
ncbi:tetratricopeptide repeat protein [Massilia sp. CCM 8734]|uniref:tetratricopeptide repeat protein n=1 Tax=Massilia sp. CCM 8734 TaxID=2609283 RepID=UPI00142339C4|nr:tetratricopeptide repeat protein [Massilia sp. CCM 8734]NHZ96835.1 tetratricopeptide repeat protein [Massilia sp. CCM 8734]